MVAKGITLDIVERLKSESLLAGKIELAFMKIQRDPEFERFFHSYDLDLQKVAIELLSRASRLDTVKTVTHFMHRNNFDRSILIRWTSRDTTRLYNIPGGKPSADLMNKIIAFREALESYHMDNQTYDNYSTLQVFFLMMRIVHGEDHVMKMLDHWMLNLENFSYSRFEKFAESWDGVKDLPLEWALKITEAE